VSSRQTDAESSAPDPCSLGMPCRVAGVLLAAFLIGACEFETRSADRVSNSTDVPTTSSAEIAADPTRPRFRFVDAAATAGLSRVIWSGRPGKDHLLDSAGTGCAFLDFDGDGTIDIYLPNGWRIEGDQVIEKGRSALYRGRPDGSFEDVTESSGTDGDGQWCAGITAADYDLDGRTDLFVTAFGACLLYRNLGGGKFENVAPRLGLDIRAWNTGAAFFDADGDDDLDLYVAGYIDCTIEQVLAAKRTLDWKGVAKVAFGPFGLTGAPDRFFVSKGALEFSDETVASGFEDRALGFGFAVRAADFDRDGDSDLFVANDSDANYLYRNEGGAFFKETGLWSGCAFSASGLAQASMGVAVGEVTGDGVVDLLVTNFAEDYSTFYRGLSNGLFEDTTAAMGLAEPTYTPMSWGTAFGDLDNDGDLDLVIANGHIYPQADAHPELGQSYLQRLQIFENREGRFVDVSSEAGPGLAIRSSARGLALGDYENDGDLDILVSSLDAAPLLLRNESAGRSWLGIVLEGPAGVIGTRVVVSVEGKKLERDAAAGDSFLSSHDPRLHFGLGAAEVADRVEVHWPKRPPTVLEMVPARQYLRVRRP
jgi:hypothetical protein